MIVNVSLQSFLLADEDIGGKKSEKAKELGYIVFLLHSLPDVASY